MFKAKAGESSIIRTTEDVFSNVMTKHRLIPAGTVGVVIEVYELPSEGYCVDVHIPGEEDDNVILEPQQFEVIEYHNIDIGGSSKLSPKKSNISG